MENYSSDSSDCDNSNKVLDFAHLLLDTDTLEHNLDVLVNTHAERKPALDVDTLILTHNHLDTVPGSICHFSHLQVLDVSSTGLRTLTDVLMYCPHLTTLLAKNNQLTNESLPKSFTVSSTLRELNLSGNRLLTAFPDQIFNFPNLKYLYLSGNNMTSISKDIWKLKSLQILSLGGNKLTEVPTGVGDLHMLQALVLCDNHLESLPASIANLHQLKSLLLHKNHLRTLPPEIVALKNLTELSLRDNPLVVRFVSDMTHTPGTLLELAARAVKVHDLPVRPGDIPHHLICYLQSGHRCVNPRCKGVYFDNRVEHIKFVDFCGKYRIPLLQYLCSAKCKTDGAVTEPDASRYMMRKVLLG